MRACLFKLITSLTAVVAALPAVGATDIGDAAGLDLLKQHNFSRAVAFYDHYLQAHPADAVGFLRRGEAWLGRGTLDLALMDLSRSIAIKPQAEAYAARGDAELGLQKSKPALQDYKNAVRMNANDSRYVCKLASLYYDLNDYPASLEMWRKAVLLQPKNGFFYQQLARATRKCDHPEEALALAKKAVALDGKQFEAWKLIAMLEHDRKHYPATITAGKQAMIGIPHDANLLKWIVDSYIQTKQYDNALALIQRESFDVDMRKRNGEFVLYLLRGETHEATGKNDLALRDYTFAITASMSNAEAFRLRAHLLKKMGRAGDAAADENAAVEATKRALDRANAVRL